MEVAAFYEAARNARSRPLFFSAKTVVDLGDKDKGDDDHDRACTISARIVVSLLASCIGNVFEDGTR